VTIYESNSEISSTGAEIAEFVDAPAEKESAPPVAKRAEPCIEYLGIYLNDHRAGASAGLALARRCRRNNEGSALGDEMASVVADLLADKESLTRIAQHLGVPQNRFKQAAARAGELIGRLKFNGEFRGYSPLSRLLEIEMLLGGIDGKRSLWRALMTARTPVPPGIDLKELEDRASNQRARLRPHQRTAAEAALVAPQSPKTRIEEHKT
jgi:hypothetical protein